MRTNGSWLLGVVVALVDAVAKAVNRVDVYKQAADMAKAYLQDPRGTNPVVRRLARCC